MAISGPIKFFRKSVCDIDNEQCVVSASSGGSVKDQIRDRRVHTRWESKGSDDTTTETLTIDFGADKDVDRLVLIRHNFKKFQVEWWNGSSWQDFSSVVTKEGSQADIRETGHTKSTSYYEVSKVTTQKVRISIDTTQSADAEKYLYSFVATTEVGTFEGYPRYQASFARAQEKKTSPFGRPKFSLRSESYQASIRFERYPYEADHTLMQDLWDEQKEFLIYPCGGDESQFRYEAKKGNRLRDIFLVWFEGDFSPNYDSNVYTLGLNYSVELTEVA